MPDVFAKRVPRGCAKVTFLQRGNGDGDEYATPPSLWRPLADAVGGFDVDPASGAEEAPIASTRYTKKDDGLAQSWRGDVWLNPPFGDTTGDGGESKRTTWLRKAQNEVQRDEVRTVTMLLPVDTSTEWFHRYVVDAPVVCYLSTRTPFNGQGVHTAFATMIVVFGDPPAELVEALTYRGAVFYGRRHEDRHVQATLEEAEP